MSAKGALHCGRSCYLGDIIAEWLAFFFPSLALLLGWQVFFEEKMFAVWVLDFILAFVLGIMFQYFAVVTSSGWPSKRANIQNFASAM